MGVNLEAGGKDDPLEDEDGLAFLGSKDKGGLALDCGRRIAGSS